MEPDRFLAGHPPFDRLSPERLEDVARELEVVFVPRGETILRRSDPENHHLFVVRKGAVRLERDGLLVQVLEEGEPFGYPSLISGGRPHVDVVAEEDTLLFRVPRALFERLMEHPPFADFFALGLADRLRRASSVEAPPLSGDLSTPVLGLVTRSPVFAEPGDTVAAAARRMRDEGISSILVRGTPPGIVTDRDLRSRVLAAGRPPETPVEEVMSRPLVGLAAQSSVFEALLVMIEDRIHHLAVLDGEEVVGMVTDADLLRHHLKSPLYLLARIEKLERPDVFGSYATELAGMVEVLAGGGLGATEIGRIVSTINDALVSRLLRLAEREMGAPPCPYAWIVFGSEGRKEQALLTDQDNALVYAGGDRAANQWFGRLAERVVDGLVKSGIPPCAGGFMATNWHRPLAEWEGLFRGWLEAPEPQALIEAANFFDFRRVHGELGLGSLEAIVREAPQHASFLAHMARNALEFGPPLGLFRRIRQQAEGVDVKRGGIIPIVSMARLFALEAGVDARGTLDRLDAAAGVGTVSRPGSEDLAEAFRFLLRLRLEHQLAAQRAGQEVGNLVPLEPLSPLERRHLKDTFVAVRGMQEAVSQRFRTDLLG